MAQNGCGLWNPVAKKKGLSYAEIASKVSNAASANHLSVHSSSGKLHVVGCHV